MSRQIVSKVWQIQGLIGKVTAGILVLDNNRVAYITEEGMQFDVPLSNLHDIKWPFLRMGLGFDTVVNGKKFKFSFSKPNPSAPEIDISGSGSLSKVRFARQYLDDISSLMDIKSDKATAKMWKEILMTKS